jgi:hypothetical protein
MKRRYRANVTNDNIKYLTDKKLTLIYIYN